MFEQIVKVFIRNQKKKNSILLTCNKLINIQFHGGNNR